MFTIDIFVEVITQAMINAIIIEDQELNRFYLKDIIEDHLSEHVVVSGEAAEINTGLELINKLKPDLVFLDIEMPGGSGFDLLEKIKVINFDIVFTTSHEDFALKAIKFSALDYLIKPVKVDELLSTINKFIQKNKITGGRKNPLEVFLQTMRKLNNREIKIGLPTRFGITYVKLSEIVRSRATGPDSSACYLTDNSKISLSCSLRELEFLLQESHFLRVHDSAIINLQHIKEYVKDGEYVAIMNDGTQVDISDRKEAEFKSKLYELRTIFN